MQLVLMTVLGLVVNSQDTSKFAQPSLQGGFKPSEFQFLLASSSKTSKILSEPSKQPEVKVVKKPNTSAFTTPSIDNEISYYAIIHFGCTDIPINQSNLSYQRPG